MIRSFVALFTLFALFTLLAGPATVQAERAPAAPSEDGAVVPVSASIIRPACSCPVAAAPPSADMSPPSPAIAPAPAAPWRRPPTVVT